MKITRECDYAIRILLMLSTIGDGKITDARTISEEQCIPLQFTLKILRKLLGAGLVRSYKGMHGGYCLNVAPKDLSINEVITLIDGGEGINECFQCGYKCNRVENVEDCPVHVKLGMVNQLLTEKLSQITFESLITK